MILITGSTGFIGRALIRQFSSIGYPVRALIRPSPRTPRLPKGVPVEVAVVSLADKRGLRAALRDVDTIIHLASAENQGSRGSLLTADIQGTENLVEAASDAGVDRLVYLSHIGAGRFFGISRIQSQRASPRNTSATGKCLTRFCALRLCTDLKTISPIIFRG